MCSVSMLVTDLIDDFVNNSRRGILCAIDMFSGVTTPQRSNDTSLVG